MDIKKPVQKKPKNPFEKSVFDEGWEVVEIKSGVKQVIIEKEEKTDGGSSNTASVSKQ